MSGIHARRATDGRLSDASHREATHPDDVLIARLWGPEESPVTICGAECQDADDHAKGLPYHVEAMYDYVAKRTKEYPSVQAMVVAMWERDVEGRPEAADALQAQREAVKAKWPKGKAP